MNEKQRPAKPRHHEEPLDIPLREDVRALHSPNRCPYCHEGIERESQAWVACEECLARHHQSCWDELARCGSCGGAQALSRGETVSDEQRQEEKRPLCPLCREDLRDDATITCAGCETSYHVSCARMSGCSTLDCSRRRARLEALFVASMGRAIQLGLKSGQRDLQPAPQDALRALRGEARVVEVERIIDETIDPSRCGVWVSRFVRVAVVPEEDRTRIRLRAITSDLSGGLFGGLVGGLGGGLGGGLSYAAALLGGLAGAAIWVVLCLLGSFLLARALFARAVRRRKALLSSVLDDLEQDLRSK